jgi:ABC-type antimicrobial peptide transport system ATPase subunit
MIFQEPMTALNPVRTIGDQVAETILVHERPSRAAARARAAEVLVRVGMPPDRFPLDRYPHELSGGQRQRVSLAMAIALRPGLLIADEPTTALDVTTQAQIIALLRDLVDDFGMGLLLITHDLALVSEVADRIVVMQAGRVVETGPARALLASPQAPYTKMLLAAARHRVDLPPAPPPSPLLEVANVTRTYRTNRGLLARKGTFRAVDGVSSGSRGASVWESWESRGAASPRSPARSWGSNPCRAARSRWADSRSGPGRARTRPCGGACRQCSRTPMAASTRGTASSGSCPSPFTSSRPRPRAPNASRPSPRR